MIWEDILKRKFSDPRKGNKKKGLTEEQKKKYFGMGGYAKAAEEAERKRKEMAASPEAKKGKEAAKRAARRRKYNSPEAREARRKAEKEYYRLAEKHGLYECRDCGSELINTDNLKEKDLVCRVCSGKGKDQFKHKIKGEEE